MDAKEKDGRCGYEIFYDKGPHIPVIEKKVHKRIDLVGSMLKMEDGKVKVENRKQENERQGKEQPLVIPVNVQVCFPVRLPPNGLTASIENVFAERFR